MVTKNVGPGVQKKKEKNISENRADGQDLQMFNVKVFVTGSRVSRYFCMNYIVWSYLVVQDTL